MKRPADGLADQFDQHTYIPIAFVFSTAVDFVANIRTSELLSWTSHTEVRMARRSAPPPRPKTPILTAGQKRRRIERLQKCVTSLEAFDPQKARKRAPAILELEAAIDKALSSAFGYGTAAYLRYTEAATLDPSPLLTSVALRVPAKAVGGPARHDAKVQETRQHFSENKTRAIALLQQAIRSLEEEIAQAEPLITAPKKSEATPVIVSDQPSEATLNAEVRPPSLSTWGGFREVLRRRVGRWWRGRNR
jgi:hypothetical protein